jgi:hypothetical protein
MALLGVFVANSVGIVEQRQRLIIEVEASFADRLSSHDPGFAVAGCRKFKVYRLSCDIRGTRAWKAQYEVIFIDDGCWTARRLPLGSRGRHPPKGLAGCIKD